MPAVECRDLVCDLGGKRVIDSCTFAVATGEWVWLLGPTGGGKTTLLRLLAGLEAPAGGEIALQGRLASSPTLLLPPRERGIGWLPQEPSLWPHLSALANVALGVAEGHRAQTRRETALAWLRRIDAEGLADRFPGELSGGEARRVTLARVLAGGPRIMLLDEPTAHLDPHLRLDLMARMRGLHDELGLTTLCVTHQIEPPMRREDRVLLLFEGGVRMDGKVEALRTAGEEPYLRAIRPALALLKDEVEGAR